MFRTGKEDREGGGETEGRGGGRGGVGVRNRNIATGYFFACKTFLTICFYLPSIKF